MSWIWYLVFFAVLCIYRAAQGWLCVCVAGGWVEVRIGWLAAWVSEWVDGVASWVGGVLVGWLAGWVTGEWLVWEGW